MHWQSCLKVSRKCKSSNYSYWGNSMEVLIDFEWWFVQLLISATCEPLITWFSLESAVFSLWFVEDYFFLHTQEYIGWWVANPGEKMKINYGINYSKVSVLETDGVYQSGVIINTFLKLMSTKPLSVSEFSLVRFIRDVRVHKIMIISLIETARNQNPYSSTLWHRHQGENCSLKIWRRG